MRRHAPSILLQTRLTGLKAADWSDAGRIEKIRNTLRAFNRKEFQGLLEVREALSER